MKTLFTSANYLSLPFVFSASKRFVDFQNQHKRFTHQSFLRLGLLFILLFAGVVTAQTLSVVGSGTAGSGTNYANPYNNGYWGNRTQHFVTAAQLTAAGVAANASVSTIAYNVTTAGTLNGANLSAFQIKVYTTTSTNPLTAWVTTGLVAQSTPVTLNVSTTGWKTTTLASPFIWDGTSNLVIETCYNNSNYTSGCQVQWTTTGLGTGTWSRFFRADNGTVCSSTSVSGTSTTSRPNIQIGWTAAVACNTTPTPGNTLSSSNTVCSGVNFTLSLQNAITGTGVSYQWQSSTDNSTWTNITGATTATRIQTQTAATYYRCNVTCSGNGTGASNSLLVQLNSFQNCYCTSAATSTADEEIFNVTLSGTTLNNSSNCSTTAPGPGSVNSFYSNYTTSVSAPVLFKTTTINFSVDANTCGTTPYSNRLSIFIDYNQNGLFTDLGEEVHTGSTVSGASIRTGSFTIPSGAITGTTRMRIIQVETTGSITPCGTYTYGETEDYLVDIQPAPAPNCATLSTPLNNSTGECFNGNGTNLTWTAPTGGGPVTGYKLYFGTDNPPTNIQNGTNIGNFLTWSTGAMSASTQYYWYVVPTGAGGDAVGCSTAVRSFTTDANPCIVPNCSAGLTAPTNGATGVSAYGANLTWLAPVGGGVPTGYRLYFGTDNPPTNIVNGSNIGNVLTWGTGLRSATTTYYWSVVPTNNTGDAIGCITVNSYTTGGLYCASNATSTGDTRIDNVTIGSINNTNTTGCQTYTNNTNLSTNLVLGTTASISITNGTCGSFYATNGVVYIDFNQDQDFLDAGEAVYTFTTPASQVVSTGTFTIPCTALVGATRLRVVLTEGTHPGPCGTYSYGETEDYMVNLTGGGLFIGSATTTQNILSVSTNSTNEQVIGVSVNVIGCGTSLNMDSLVLNTTGTTNVADISNARLWYTGSTNAFSAVNQYGSTVAVPNGAFTISGTQSMSPGLNYFWLTYDVPSGATLGNVIDAQCTQVVAGNAVTPNPTSPTGNRVIVTNCSGTPNAGTVTPSTTNITIGQTYVLNATGFTTDAGITFQWQMSTDNSNWTNISGQTNLTYSYTAVAETRYFRYVSACSFSGQSNNSASAAMNFNGVINMPTSGNIAVCSALFYDSGGSTGQYTNSENRTVTFTPLTPGGKIRLTFNSFDTECNWDFLRIFNGPTTLSPALHTGSGFNCTTSPGVIFSTAPNGELTLQFTSDGSGLANGWEAVISCDLPCAGTPVAGTATSTVATAGFGQPLTLNATGLNLNQLGINYQWEESSDSINWTSISGATAIQTAYEFRSTSTRYFRLAVTCSNSNQTSTSVPVVVPFNNTVWMPIIGSITSCSGTIYDEGGPSANYTNNQNRIFTLTPSISGQKMQAIFTAFSLENLNDVLRVYDGPNITSPALHIGTGFTGTVSPGVLTSTATNGELTFEFVTNASIVNTGWEAVFGCVLPCSGTPVGGSSSPTNGTATIGQVLPLSATGYTLGSGITYQWQRSLDNSTWTNISGATGVTAVDTMYNITTQYYRLKVLCTNSSDSVYSTIASYSFNGILNMPASGSYSLCQANFFDSGGSAAVYSANENRTITIVPALAGNKMIVTFNSFNTQLNNDFLRIYNGPDTLSPPIHTGNGFSGTTNPGSFTSSATGGELTFKFVSNATTQNAGWDATLVCQAPCSGQPNIAAVSASQTICYGNTTVLTVNGVTSGFDITNQWQQSTDGGNTWVSAVGGSGATTLSYTTPRIFTPIQYRFAATCANGPVTAESNPVILSVSNTPTQYAALPYTQSFENWANTCAQFDRPDATSSVNLPNFGNSSWRRQDQGSFGSWTNTLGLYSPVSTLGLSSARFHSYQNIDSGDLYFYVNCSVSGTKTVTFDYFTNTGADYINVFYSTDGGSSFTLLAGNLTTSTSWSNFNQVLPSSSAQTVVRIQAIGNGTNTSDIGVDNLVISVPCSGTPSAGLNPAFSGICSGSSVALVVTGASAGSGIAYQWEEFNGSNWINAVGGSGSTTTAYTTPTLTANKQYRIAVSCANSSQTINGSAITAQVLNCTYSVSRTTGITYSSIVGNGGVPVTSWLSGTSADDNYSNPIPVGFDFFYKGALRNVFTVSTNGWMSFNTSVGGSFFSNISTSVTLGLAPFWDDLVCLGNSSTNLNSTIYTLVTGTSPNRVMTIEWRNMETYFNAGPNLNFQVKLYETTQNIEFLYGEMEGYDGTNDYTFSYTAGLTGSVSTDYQFQLLDNLQNFSSTVQTASLTRVPVCNTKYTFTDGAYVLGSPSAYAAPSNDEPANAVVVTPNIGPCTDLCGTYFTSRLATGSTTSGLAPAIGGTTASGDVFFTFTTSSSTNYLIRVLGAGGFDPAVQLLNSNLSLNGSNQINATGAGLTENMNITGLSPNTQYYIRIYHASGGTGTDGGFSLCVSEVVPPPSNDNVAGAVALTVSSTCSPVNSPLPNVLVATASPQTVCTGTADDDVWYSFVAPATNPVITVQSGVGYNAVAQLMSTTFTSLSCTDNTSTGGSEVINATGLTIGATYYVRVYHFASGAGSGQFSICVTAATPTCASGITPPNNTAGVPLNQVLSWTAVSGATGYDVYLSTNQSLVNSLDTSVRVSQNQVGTTYNPGGLANATTFYWRVVPRNLVGPTTSCSVNTLHTLPSNITPIYTTNSYICTGSSTSLSVNPQNGQVYWFQGSCGNNVNNAIGNSLLQTVSPTSTTSYYVRGFYQGVWSQGCEMAVVYVVPNLGAPSNLAVNGVPICNGFNVTWNAVSGASYYTLDVSTSSNFTNFVGVYNALNVGSGTSASVTGLTPGTPYYVRVRGVASQSGTDCPGTASSSITVNTASSPVTVFTVTGGGNICGTGNSLIGLSGSTPGILYRLYRNGSTLVDSLTGTGFMVQFPGVTVAGTYTVIAETGITGCSQAAMSGTAIVQIFNQPLSVSTSSVNENCRNSGTGTASAVVSGGSGQYNYTWSNGGTNATLTGLNTGTYTVTIADAGCTVLTPVNSSAVVGFTWGANAGVDAAQCVGNNFSRTGTLVGTATSPIYAWFRPNGNQVNNATITANNLGSPDAGNYVFRVTAGGCISYDTLVLAVNTQLTNISLGANTPVCTGLSINMTSGSHPGATYLWQGPNGYSSTVQNPIISSAILSNTGVYTLTMTSPGCSSSLSSTTIIGVVQSNPVNLSSNTPVCNGGTLTLTVNNVPGNTNYAWAGPNAFTSNTQNISFTNVPVTRSGIYSLTVLQTPCNTMVTYTTTAVIGGTPSASNATSNSPICSANILTLSAATVANASYSWSGPNGFTSNQQYPSIFPANTTHSGVYSMTVNSPACGTASYTTSVLVQPVLSVSFGSNSPLCSGNALYLSSSSNVPGVNYIWSGPNGYTSTSPSPAISNAQTVNSGVYTVVSTKPGCPTLTQVITVSVNSGIGGITASSNSPVCESSALNLSSTQVSGATYSWTGPNGFTSASPVPTILSAQSIHAGSYQLTVSSPGCGSVSRQINVMVNSTSNMSGGSNSPVCSGGILNLTSNIVSGASYLWAGPNGFSSSLSNPALINVQTLSSGTYSLTVSIAGCSAYSTTVPVTVNQSLGTVTAGSNGPVCSPGDLILSATSYSGASYVWSGPSGFTSAAPVDTIFAATTANSGAYSLTVSANGCPGTNLIVNVLVNPSLSAVATANSPVCSGSALYLSASNHIGATYAWSGPNSFSSSSQNPSISSISSLSAGTYSLTVTQPGCGSQSQTVSVVVGPSPSSINYGTNAPICANQTLTVSADNVSGVTYVWTGPNGFTSSVASNSIPNASIASSGVYSLSMTSPGCAAINHLILADVNTQVSPVASVLGSPLCEGAAIRFASTTIPNGTYSWSGPSGFISTVQNPAISFGNTTHTGVYTLNTLQPGCGSGSSTVSVTVGASLAGLNGGSNSPVCVGGTLNLTSVNRSGVTYSWSGPNGFTSSSSSASIPNITTGVAGNYTLTTSSSGCGSVSYLVKVTVNNPVGMSASNNTPICAGGVVQLNATGAPRATYAWAGPNSYASTLQAPSIVNAPSTVSGVYTVTITDPTCGPLQYTTTVQVGANLNQTGATSNSPVCVGSNLNLSATTLSGATYAWVGPNGFTSATQNPVITPVTSLAAGTYSVSIATVGCNSVTRTTVVAVNPALTANPTSNSPVCQGGILYLNSPSVTGATYSWTGPNSFVSTLQNVAISNVQPSSSGIYTLTINTSNCGSASGTVNVSVGGVLSSVSLSSNGPVCVGNQLNLFSTLVSSGTITWTAPDGFTSSAQNPTRPGILSNGGGVYTYTANSPGCGSITRTLSVLVNPSPVLNAGSNSPVCQGSAIFLTVNTISGATYSWTGPNSYAVSGQNPSISNAQPIRSGVYTLSVTNSSCGTTTTTTTVAVNSSLGSLSATSNTPVCTGNTLNLNITNRTGFTFVWTGPNGFTSTNASPTRAAVTGADAGRYSVVVSSAGCGSMTVQTNPVLVNNPASVTASGTSPVCVGAVIFFSGVAPTGSTYSWSGPAGFVSTIQNPSRSNSQLLHAGVYTLNATVPGCGVVSATTTVNVNSCRETQTTDVKDLTGGELNQQTEDSQVGGVKAETAQGLNAQAKLSAWPNPNSGDVVVLKWEGLTGEDRTITVRIFDATGREVLLKSVNYDLSGMAVEELAFPVRLSKGLYTIETVHDERFVYTKLIIE
jgi:hypothetical protein